MLDSVLIGEQIRKLRTQQEISQDELAEKLFVTRQAISRWELGLALPSVDSLCEISRIFQTSIDEILCINVHVSIDKNNPFQGRNREVVINDALIKKSPISIEDIFYLLSNEERMEVLKKVRKNPSKFNIDSLWVKLTDAEKMFLNRTRYKGEEKQHGHIRY